MKVNRKGDFSCVGIATDNVSSVSLITNEEHEDMDNLRFLPQSDNKTSRVTVEKWFKVYRSKMSNRWEFFKDGSYYAIFIVNPDVYGTIFSPEVIK